jgi:hypothetical protein
MSQFNHQPVALDQMNTQDRAVTLLGLVYMDLQRVLDKQPELSMDLHPTILSELVRLGYHEPEPLRIIIRHKLLHHSCYLIKPPLLNIIPTNEELKESVLSLYSKCFLPLHWRLLTL